MNDYTYLNRKEDPYQEYKDILFFELVTTLDRSLSEREKIIYDNNEPFIRDAFKNDVPQCIVVKKFCDIFFLNIPVK